MNLSPWMGTGVVFGVFAGMPASAVIVAGLSGTGNNNAGQASLDAYLGTTGYAPFPYFSNLVRVSNASGVYLGWNAGTDRGWVLSAEHISPEPASIGIGGSFYTVDSAGIQVSGSDLILYRVSRTAQPVPAMPTVALAAAFASTGEFALMTGRAYTNNTSAPYTWVNPDVSDAVPVRWATNTVEGNALVNLGTQQNPNVQRYIVTDFDGPNDPGATAYDGQGALGDSGGGLFIYRSGAWVLAGATHFVDDAPDFLESSPTGDGSVNPSIHGDFTAYTDIRQHLTTIQGITGPLVPESGTWLLAAGGTMLLMRRSRRG